MVKKYFFLRFNFVLKRAHYEVFCVTHELLRKPCIFWMVKKVIFSLLFCFKTGILLSINGSFYSATTRTKATQSNFETNWNKLITSRDLDNEIAQNYTWPVHCAMCCYGAFSGSLDLDYGSTYIFNGFKCSQRVRSASHWDLDLYGAFSGSKLDMCNFCLSTF